MRNISSGSWKKASIDMGRMTDNYLELLRFCLNTDLAIPACVKDINWHELREFAKKQAIAGVYWQGIRLLQDLPENKPTDDDVLEWMSTCGKIQKNNRKLNEKSAWTYQNFLKEGFDSCILKGQGNALYYPHPELRMSGDVDVWVKGDDRHIIKYVKELRPKARALYHHIDFMKKDDVEIEVHYRPCWLSNPIHNRRLQAYFSQTDFNNMAVNELGFKAPDATFNAVFQLCHIYNHLLHEGIGLRQVCDYYYLLKHPTLDRRQAASDISRLGLAPIAQALMWVLHEQLGLETQFLVATSDARRGQLLYHEIISGGNFGHFDQRTLSGTYRSPLKANLQRLVRDFRMMRSFPSESLCEPVFRLYHAFWRLRHN